MATSTQYNPQAALNEILLAAGASKTVYALVTPETEAAKAATFGNEGDADRAAYLEQFHDAWTAKQDAFHQEFFDTWHRWSAPVVDLDRQEFPFYYPTAGASEPLRHIIFDHAAKHSMARIHVFEGEYEGYKAMAEAAGLRVIEHPRAEWAAHSNPFRWFSDRASNPDVAMAPGDLFFISQPSAIDGNVWSDFNEFVFRMPKNSMVIDLTYVGAVPQRAVPERFNMNQPAVRNVVFSLSKPFGAYYDRIGGVFCREENLGLFGNKWFKGLTGIRLGTILMNRHDVFYMPEQYGPYQRAATVRVAKEIGVHLLEPSDVFLLATGDTDFENPLADYLRRGGRVRVCLTPGIAAKIRIVGE